MKPLIRQCLLISALVCAVRSASPYNIVVGPFQAGSGHYDLVPGGDFETSLSGWSLIQSQPALGQASIVADHALDGEHSLQLTALQTFTGPGFALAAPQMTLSAGVSYTLSGFILTSRLPAHGATVYFDLNDSPGETWENGQTQWYGSGGVPAGGSLQWQFVWATYTPTHTVTVSPRVSVDTGDHTGTAYVDAGDVFYIDNMALTETSRFTLPVVVPDLAIDLFAGLTLTGTPGRTYRIEYATVVPPGAWQVLTNLVLPATPYLFIDQTSPATSERRFYRAVELP